VSLREIPTWTVDCDRCGHNADSEGDFTSWVDKESAVLEATESGWLVTDDGGHYCDRCIIWDDQKDERVPLPEVSAS